jgi:hypothetical protein
MLLCLDGHGLNSRSKARLLVIDQKIQGINFDPLSDPFQHPERDVPLAPLQAAHISAVHSDEVGECLLAEATCNPVSSQVAAHPPLQIALHQGRSVAICYL